MDATAAAASSPVASSLAGGAGRVSVGTILGGTMRILRTNALPFLVAAFVLELPSTWVQYSAAAAVARGEPLRPFSGALLTSLAFLLLTAMTTAGALEALAGRPVRLSGMLATGLRRFGRVFAVSLLTNLIIGVATLLLVIPGLMAFSALWLAVPAVIAEPDDRRSPVERSRELTKGHRWTIFLTFVLVLLLNLAAAGALEAATALAPFEAGAPLALAAALVGTAISAVTTGIWAMAPAVAFHELRTLKEGGDASALGGVFE